MITQVLGIDPGREGAFAVIPLASRMMRVWDMPKTKERGINLYAVADILAQISVTGTTVCLEWNTGRPGEVPDFAFKFGLQTGQLDGLLHARGYPIKRIASVVWTGKLGLAGKTWAGSIQQRAAMWDSLYPSWSHLVRGPKGGILDGRLDALLIAEWMRRTEASPLGVWGGKRPAKFLGCAGPGL